MSTPENPLPRHFDESYGYSEKHKDYHPDGPARPGYFKLDGQLCRIPRAGEWTERFNKEKGAWEKHPDEVYAFQNAQRLTPEEAEKLAEKHGVPKHLMRLEIA